jgi:hypothetical protein
LRYYIPGSRADYRADRELRQMKYRTDSLERELKFGSNTGGFTKSVEGDVTTKLDTTLINVPKEEIVGN